MNKRIFGQNQWVSNDDMHSGFNNNDIIVGGSGSGKTGSYVIPNIQKAYGNMIVTDTKSQLYRLLGDDLRKQGYQVHVLDFVNPEKSMAYNPLRYIRKINGEYSQKDIVSLARALLPRKIHNDPYWEERARAVLTFLIAYTLEVLQEQEHTMRTVTDLFPIFTNNQKKIEATLYKRQDSFAYRKYESFKSVQESEKTWSCICDTVQSCLEAFDFKEMNSIFGYHPDNEFVISNLWKKKEIVFLNVSDTDRYADQLANLFYTQAMQQLCLYADTQEKGRLPYPVRFILDDFAANAYIEDFDKLISVIRSRNISVSVIVQSLTQLESMYSKTKANTIITNCDHILYLGGQDIETAQYIGYRCNKPEETILQMKTGEAYLIERGSVGKRIQRIQPYSSFQETEHFDESLPF